MSKPKNATAEELKDSVHKSYEESVGRPVKDHESTTINDIVDEYVAKRDGKK